MCEEVAGNGTDGPPSWRDGIIANCRLWIESLEDIPTASGPVEEPDLYSFYEQLSVLKSEFRKNSRRTHETFSRFGENIEEFQGVLASLEKRLDMLPADRVSTDILNRQKLLLPIAEVYERMRRFGERLRETAVPEQEEKEAPSPGLWHKIRRKLAAGPQEEPGDNRAVTEGFFLALSHFEELLSREGVLRIDVRGKPFDPSYMVAVAAVPVEEGEPDMVWEEIEGGYAFGEQVLKFAKVTVTKRKES